MSGAASLERMALEADQRISEVVEREQSRLRNFIRRRVPDPRDAEDILQDVFYELVEANRLLMPIEHVTGWLFRVARNRITDLFRKKKPESFGDAAVDGRRAANGCASKTCCLRPTPGPRRSMPAACCSTNSSPRSASFRQSSARCLWRTSWKGAASRRSPPRPA